MENFIKHFRREGGGRWLCVEPASIDLPQGHIEVVPGTRLSVGQTYMNVDLARMLDEQYSRANRPRQ